MSIDTTPSPTASLDEPIEALLVEVDDDEPEVAPSPPARYVSSRH